MGKDANDFLMGGGGSYASFADPARYEGVVLDFEVRQQRDLKTGELKTWPDGNPVNILFISLQTDEHEDEDDDGVRNIWAGYAMRQAIKKAVKDAKAEKMERRGWLAIEWKGKQEKPKKRGFEGAKIYNVEYEAPDPTDLDDDDQRDDDEPPARSSRNGRAATASRSSGRQRRADPEPDADDTDDEPPARRARRGAAKATAGARRGRARDDSYEEDGGESF